LSRTAQNFVFLGIVLAILGVTHGYLWLRLVRDPALGGAWRRLVTIALIVMPVVTIGSFLVGRVWPLGGRLLRWPAHLWIGLFFLLFATLVAEDLVRLVLWVATSLGSGRPADPSRRLFLARVVASVSAAVAAGAGAVGVFSALGRLRVKDVRVKITRLPRSLDGTTIAQITDVHVGDLLGRPIVEEIVRVTNGIRPDLIAITGDLVDDTVAEIGDAIAPLAGLEAKHGVFFVTGNHEYIVSLGRRGADEWIAELGRLGIRTLQNERVTIGEGEASFELAGVHDSDAHRFTDGAHRTDVDRALDGRDRSRACVLLAHQPKVVKDAARLGVDLQLSGHTHGGQIWPFGWLVRLTQPVVAGLGREGETAVYVSRGTGFWGPPMRLGNPAEITRIVLEAG
jgi:hypothetical protein